MGGQVLKSAACVAAMAADRLAMNADGSAFRGVRAGWLSYVYLIAIHDKHGDE
jgi:hypothetical protein